MIVANYLAEPGIYLLEFPDGNYVGQSNNIKSRLFQHTSKMAERIHPNKRIRRGFAAYGMPEISVLCYCPLDQLNNAEIYWMGVHDCYPAGYNQQPGGGYPRKGLVDAPYTGVGEVVENGSFVFDRPLSVLDANINRLDSPSFRYTLEHSPFMDVLKLLGFAVLSGIGYLFWVNPPAAIGVIFLLLLILKLQQ